ncbi:hypothetical protein ABMA27_001333 [Loxostege sticticalis]|uniref:FLYWCH-type domain-containing protein n=1 Tax=Loxostege sticticalis TaxID=481309 RepID=A0ABR3HY25_LOXSC
MLGGYTFARISDTHYYCSKKSVGCKAKLRMGPGEQIVYADNTHNHEPPEYHVSKSGEYVLVRKKIKYRIHNRTEQQRQCQWSRSGLQGLHLRQNGQQEPLVLLQEVQWLQGETPRGRTD